LKLSLPFARPTSSCVTRVPLFLGNIIVVGLSLEASGFTTIFCLIVVSGSFSILCL
jgi:hypothetical protein